MQDVIDLADSESKSDSIPDGVGRQPTFAVRGATIARPDGYCLCWDTDKPILEMCAKGGNDSISGIRQQEYRNFIKRRSRRRRELHRLVLPRVLDCNVGNSALENSLMTMSDRYKRCVQFLNVDGSHAVRLFTPPFLGGPLETPITIICVAIATEDGCFLSGLKSRFEFGHLYPQNDQDRLSERSPISLCTAVTSEEPQRCHQGPGSIDGIYNGCEADSSNSDDSSCYFSSSVAARDTGFRCTCQFASLGESTDNHYEEDEPTRLFRGARGPGSWHCYAAVVDGANSIIRIDGKNEPISDDGAGTTTFLASLDGLTIGSDHTFDMSLCFGHGSDGEGEGAIAELVLFKGRLPLNDVYVLEKYLMDKHGILAPSRSNLKLAQDDQWSRQAHALLSHPPNHKLINSSTVRVPLRFLTKHRIVAWKQTHPVTGKALQVQKIGSNRLGCSSSEW